LTPARAARSGRRGAVHVGTSGWAYDDWQCAFYPRDVTGAQRLPWYAQRFDTVELNASFYRVPTEPMIAAWNRNLPAGFRLAVKGSRRITHVKRLAGCEEELDFFFERVLRLRHLAVVLWQLPPSFRKDVERLAGFLALLPKGVRYAFEFRHASWWDDEVARVLRRRRAAFVAVSHPELPADVVPTGDLLYVRFHGLGPRLYDYGYSRAELEGWARRLLPLLPGRHLYAYFNNDYRARAPRDAARLRALLGGA
jgi:uncharacterized protein YecE (DUF72 family)